MVFGGAQLACQRVIVLTGDPDAAARGRKVGIFTTVHVVCRPTQKEAEEYVRYYAHENADEGAVETMFVGRGWRDH